MNYVVSMVDNDANVEAARSTMLIGTSLLREMASAGLVYGPAFGLVLETAPGAGARVTMRLPRFRPGVVIS